MLKVWLFLQDRRNLVSFYIWGCLILELVLRNIIGGTPLQSFLYSRGFPFVYYVWTFFFVIKDSQENNTVRDSCNYFIWAVIFFGFVSWIFCPTGHSIGNLGLLMHQVTMSYLIFTMFRHYSLEENKEFMIRTAKTFVVFILVVNLMNLFMYTTKQYDLFVFSKNQTVIETGHAGKAFRYIGLHEFPTSPGYLSVVSILLSLFLCYSKVIQPIPAGFNIFVSLAMVYINDTRNAIIQCGIVFFAGIYMLFRKQLNRKKAIGTLCFLVTACVLILGFAYKEKAAEIISRIISDPYNALNGYSTNRLFIYRNALQLISQRPLLGYGWYNHAPLQQAAGNYAHCHNIFIAMAYWAGIPCLISFIGFVVSALLGLVHNRNFIAEANGFWPCVLVLCIFFESLLDLAVMGDLLRLETAFFWICLGYLLYGKGRDHVGEE